MTSPTSHQRDNFHDVAVSENAIFAFGFFDNHTIDFYGAAHFDASQDIQQSLYAVVFGDGLVLAVDLKLHALL